jgi:hypothetical protein
MCATCELLPKLAEEIRPIMNKYSTDSDKEERDKKAHIFVLTLLRFALGLAITIDLSNEGFNACLGQAQNDVDNAANLLGSIH